MTLNKLRREVRRLDQRARRAKTRHDKLRLKVALEGKEGSDLSWDGYNLWRLRYDVQTYQHEAYKLRKEIKLTKWREGA